MTLEKLNPFKHRHDKQDRPAEIPPAAQPSPIPAGGYKPQNQPQEVPKEQVILTIQQASHKRHHVKLERKPLLRLEVRDLSSKGAQSFLRLPNLATALEEAVQHVLDHLYIDKSLDAIPPTRSVTLIVRDMPGVAYTTGSDLDQDHKEIHLSTQHIEHFEGKRCEEEIMGVLVHEMVHAWQLNGQGQAPGGLIEGVADYVRLKAGYAPPHWKHAWDCDWDAGYEKTGYFLDWLDKKYGEATVRNINESLQSCYDAKPFWKNCCGHEIDDLWKKYAKAMSHKEA